MSKNLLFLVGLVAVAGCGKKDAYVPAAVKKEAAVTIDKSNQTQLYPVSVGASWVYEMELSREEKGKPTQKGNFNIEYRIAKVIKESDTAQRVIFETYQEGTKKDEQEWLFNSDGIFMMSLKQDRVAYEPKQPILPFPIEQGKEFTWKGKGITPAGGRGEMDYKYKVGETQPTDTDMGTLNALFCESSGTFKNSDGSAGVIGTNTWFALGKGLVRYKQMIVVKNVRSVITLRLKSYTVK